MTASIRYYAGLVKTCRKSWHFYCRPERCFNRYSDSLAIQRELISVAAHLECALLALTGDASLYFMNTTIMTVKSLAKIYLR